MDCVLICGGFVGEDVRSVLNKRSGRTSSLTVACEITEFSDVAYA